MGTTPIEVGHTVNSQWFLEQVENVNIKHYIKHSSPWQWYDYYFNSANFLANLFEEGCQCSNTINALQIALSLQIYQ